MLHGRMIPCRGLNDCILVAFSAPLVPRMSLKPSQKRYLRSLAHALKPVIMVGNKGITDAVRAELSLALERHELIKVRLAGDDRAERSAQAAELARAGDAEVVQTIGKIACLYRRNDEAPRIALPR
jgi:RNA-binding protein